MSADNKNRHGLLHNLESELNGLDESIQQLRGLIKNTEGVEREKYQNLLDSCLSKREKLVQKINTEKENEKS